MWYFNQVGVVLGTYYGVRPFLIGEQLNLAENLVRHQTRNHCLFHRVALGYQFESALEHRVEVRGHWPALVDELILAEFLDFNARPNHVRVVTKQSEQINLV